MRAAGFFIGLMNFVIGLAAPAVEIHSNAPPSASGCFPFADPHCGIGTYCQCRDGRIYLFNRATGNCDPPWGYAGDSIRSLPGYRCNK
ncbi:hypothetical protein N7517_010286 [Penicillium concentricum]|uniref:Chitin-binding type-2 domain-containing protein n=1 Tax=Penicillium concentricum TaxID=293559 RepID=A0A9W9USG5_9EURO|nr:uncharacterized protein N7517_010286 [Penicillium concentricum]KAJ5355677.1 hypothetical protein N7517_010286 [Penicillium concentricum]